MKKTTIKKNTNFIVEAICVSPITGEQHWGTVGRSATMDGAEKQGLAAVKLGRGKTFLEYRIVPREAYLAR